MTDQKTLSQMASIFLETKYHVSGDTEVCVDHSLDTIPEEFREAYRGSAVDVADIMDAFGRECVSAYIESRKAAQLADDATIAAQAARIEALEAGLIKTDPWVQPNGIWLCMHCGHTYDILASGKPEELHNPDCVWLTSFTAAALLAKGQE